MTARPELTGQWQLKPDLSEDAMSMSTQLATRSSQHPLGGTSGGWRHRLLRFHVPLALASALVLVLFMTLPAFDVSRERGEHGSARHGDRDHARHHGRRARAMDHHGGQVGPTDHHVSQAGPMDHSGDHTRRSFNQRFTVATGYVALGLLALTLLIGPANLLLRRRNPVSNYLRRDVGMWTAVFSIVHVIFALQAHGGLTIRGILIFFVRDGRLLTNNFGLGNWTGLAALVIVVGLLALSSDLALRKLKAGPWKWIQRLNYALFALVIAHAFFYGALLRMTSPFTLLLGLSLIAVFVGQAVGIWLWRRKYARTAA